MQESVYRPRIQHRRHPDDDPNILVVLIDDAGPGLPSAFGGEVNTPTLDRLLDEGINYRSVGWCSALQGGGEGPRGRAVKARACSGRDGSAVRCTGAGSTVEHHRQSPRSRNPTTSVVPASSARRVRGTLAASAETKPP